MCARQIKFVLATLVALTPVHVAFAADECKALSDDCVAVGGWNFSVALGAGVRTNPLLHGSDIPLVVVPQFSYYGRRFFIDNLDLGVTLEENNTQTLSLVASPGYDRVFFYRSDLQNFFIGGFGGNSLSANTGKGSPQVPANSPGLLGKEEIPQRARQVTYLAGPEWTFKYRRVSGQLDFLHEITGRDHGDELRAAVGIPLVETRGTLTANVGFTWKSAAIVNYYYGAPSVYQAGAALNPLPEAGLFTAPARKVEFHGIRPLRAAGKRHSRQPDRRAALRDDGLCRDDLRVLSGTTCDIGSGRRV